MNTISNLRGIEFLTESGKIDNIPIDYTSAKHQQVDRGYFGAFVESQKDAQKKELLSLRKVMHWREMIAEEDVSPADDSLPTNEQKENDSSLIVFLGQVNQSLAESTWYKDAEFCKLLGDSLQQFTKLHPFSERENGRIARLIANYIATYCGKPLIVFKSNNYEKEAYQIALTSQEKMWIFIAQKIQEAVYSLTGELMIQVPVINEEDKQRMGVKYKSIASNEELIVQWHPLKAAIEDWRRKTEK